MWETIEIVGISHTASCTARQDGGGFKSEDSTPTQKSAGGVVLCRPSCVPFSNSRSMSHRPFLAMVWGGSPSLLQGISRHGLSIELLKCYCKIGAFQMLSGKITGRFRAQAVS